MNPKEKIFEELFDKNYATREVEIIPEKLFVTLKTLTPKDYLDIDTKMFDVKGTKLGVMQKLGLEKLAHSILKYKNTTFANSDETLKFISEMSASITDRLLKEQDAFEKEVRECLNIQEIEDHFFAQGDLQEKPEQSPKA